MAKSYCEVPDCGTELRAGCGTHGGLAICDRCKSSLYYWRGKARREGPTVIKDRRDQLAFLTLRTEYLEGHIGRLIRSAKRSTAQAVQRARDARAH